MSRSIYKSQEGEARIQALYDEALGGLEHESLMVGRQRLANRPTLLWSRSVAPSLEEGGHFLASGRLNCGP
jgi:hypothetical protein